MATYDDPEWVHAFLKILMERKRVFIDSMRGAHIDISELGGGDASSTVISPKIFDAFVAPYDAPLIERAHAAGQRIVYHTCGGMMPFLERLADMKPDAMETFTPPGMGADVDPARSKAADRRQGLLHRRVRPEGVLRRRDAGGNASCGAGMLRSGRHRVAGISSAPQTTSSMPRSRCWTRSRMKRGNACTEAWKKAKGEGRRTKSVCPWVPLPAFLPSSFFLLPYSSVHPPHSRSEHNHPHRQRGEAAQDAADRDIDSVVRLHEHRS